MDTLRSNFTDLKKTFDEIIALMEPVVLDIIMPSMPAGPEDDQIGRTMRTFNTGLDKFLCDLLANRQVQSETRGMSGTKNEQLRDLVDRCKYLVPMIKTSVNDYIDNIIREKFGQEPVTQQQVNALLGSGSIVSDGNIDKVALTKLRKFTRENANADYYEYIRTQRAKLYNTDQDILLSPLDRFGLIPKSARKGSELWPESVNGNSIVKNGNTCDLEKIKEIILGSDKNTIILQLSGNIGYSFGTIMPQADDVTVPINADFINRMKIVSQYPVAASKVGNIFHMPNVGKVTSVYETYDYETFFFMTPGLNGNLVSYQRAIGYYFARTGNIDSVSGIIDTKDLQKSKVPCISHVGYNDDANRLFAENYYRLDLTLLATEFKFGSGLSDSIKDRLKELMVLQSEDYLQIDIAQLIRQAINDVLPKDITRESAITSYLGTIRLVDEFKKEYLNAVRETNWESLRKIAMVDVFNRCSAKCDKLNAWAIDFKSPKDLFWK